MGRWTQPVPSQIDRDRLPRPKPTGLAEAGRPGAGRAHRHARHFPSRQVAADQGNDSRALSEEGLHRPSVDCATSRCLLGDGARVRASRRADRAPGNSRKPHLASGPPSEDAGDSRQGPASLRNSDAERLAVGEYSQAGASPPRLRTGVTGRPATPRSRRRWRDSGTSAGRRRSRRVETGSCDW